MDSSQGPLGLLQELGQHVWLNELHRALLRGFQLARLIEDGISGIAPDPVRLQTAVHADPGYAMEIFLCREGKVAVGPAEAYEQLILRHARDAADAFLRLYERSEGQLGLVSLPVLSRPGADTPAIVAEARRLWQALERPNALVAVPSSRAGIAALRELVASGINVNATMIFGVRRYREVLDAYAAGLEERLTAARRLGSVVSVAGFPLNRIDRLVDEQLASIRDAEERARARAFLGKAGIGVARYAYQELKRFTASPRWRALLSRGANPQRLLWASAGIPSDGDGEIKYVDELVGPETISAMSLAALSKYSEHGRPSPTLEENLYETAVLAAELGRFGIDLDLLSERLESEVAVEFAAAIDATISDIASRCSGI